MHGPLARCNQARNRIERIISHLDWLPTLLAAAGEPGIKEKLLKGHQVGKKSFRCISTAILSAALQG